MKQLTSVLSLILISLFILNACSKGGGGNNPPNNPCAGISVVVNGTAVNPTTVGGTNGSITVTATGGSGFTYSINGGTYQAGAVFNNLAAGTHTVTAKNSDGCTGSRQFTLTNPTPSCTGVNIVVTANATAATPCNTPATGSIAASATGSTGFTYSINGGTFQASGTFTSLAPGDYTVTARDANGCTGTAAVTITSAAAGPLFTAVRSLLNTNCVSCHNNSIANGGMNWTVDCNIVINKDRVKARAVDNNPSSMPPTGPLAQADKDKITAWINAGGRFSD